MQITLGKAVAVALSRQRRKCKAALDRAMKTNKAMNGLAWEPVELARRRLNAVNDLIEEYKRNDQG